MVVHLKDRINKILPHRLEQKKKKKETSCTSASVTGKKAPDFRVEVDYCNVLYSIIVFVNSDPEDRFRDIFISHYSTGE